MMEKMNLLSIDPIEALPKDFKTLENLTGHNGLREQLTKALVGWVLQAELRDYLGHSKNQLLAVAVRTEATGLAGRRSKANLAPYPSDFPRQNWYVRAPTHHKVLDPLQQL